MFGRVEERATGEREDGGGGRFGREGGQASAEQ